MVGERVVIRPAGVADAAELATLGARTFRATYRGDIPTAALDDHVATHFGPALQHAELTDPSRQVLVAEAGSTMVGYALLHAAVSPIPAVPDATVQLERLYVDDRAQARGVGTALRTRADELARADGHRQMWLTVWERNRRALAVYRRWGFTDVGRVAFELAGEVQEDRVLVRTLG